MKFFKKITVGLMVLAGSIHMGWAWGESKTTESSTATIEFAAESDGGGKNCSFYVRDREQDFSGTPCGNDQASYFRLLNVPSATEIWLYDKPGCSRADWFFGMKTIVHPISTIWISTESLRDMKEGDVVKKGLQMIENGNDGDQIRGKLSCMKIVMSLPGWWP
ncbi:hypothetical protein ACW9HW_12230 [Pseudomonas sp. SDO5532_S415]